MFLQKITFLAPSLDFRVFYTAFSKRNSSVVASSLLVGFSLIQIMIFVFESFLQQFPNENRYFSYVHAVSRFVYMINLLSINVTLYQVIRILAWVASLSYLLIFLTVRILLYNKRKFRTLDRIFSFMNENNTTLFLLPCLEVFLKDIICDEQILKAENTECLVGGQLLVFVLAVISALAGLIMAFLTIFYSQNGVYDKENYLSGDNKSYDAMITLAKILLALMATFMDNSTALGVRQAYFALNLLFAIVTFLYFIWFIPYNKLTIEMIALVLMTMYLVLSIGTVVGSASNKPEFMASVPFLSFFLLMLIASVYFYQENKLRLVVKEKISSVSELVRKVQCIFQLKYSEEMLSNEGIYFRGVIIRHMTNCTESDCFCRQKELYDPKKNRTTDMAKWTSSKALTLKYYARQLFEDQLKLTPHDPALLISYAAFLFQKFHNTHLPLAMLLSATNSKVFLYPQQKQAIWKLRHQISEYIGLKNIDDLGVSLEIENVLEVEERFSHIISMIKKIIQSSVSFWRYLSQRELKMLEIHKLADVLSSTVDETIKLWSPLKPYLYKHKKLMYYYNWFLKEFLSKKVILSEEGIDDLFDDDHNSVHSHDLIHNLKDDHVLFHNDTPIVHISGNPMDLGKILKVNRAAVKAFKIPRDDLIKSNVSKLMPNMIGSKHHHFLETYIKTGKTRALYTQRKTFGRDGEGFIMPLWIVIKQYNNPEGLIEYVGMLKLMSVTSEEPHEHIIFDDYGEVGGMTRNLIKQFSIEEKNMQKKSFNIIMLAPKLIKYLFFRKFLQNKKWEKEQSKTLIEKESMKNRIQVVGHEIISPELHRRFNFPIYEEDPTEIPGQNGSSDQLNRGILNEHSSSANFERSSDSSKKIARTFDIQDFLEHDLQTENEPDDSETWWKEWKEKEIQFTMRIPKNFDYFIKEFESLKARQIESLSQQQQFVDIVNMNIMSNRSAHANILSNRSGIDSTRNLLLESGRNKIKQVVDRTKHTFESYMNALKVLSQKIAKAPSSQVYNVKGAICCDYYGPDGDQLKYLKITHVAPHKNTTTVTSVSPMNPAFGFQGGFSHAMHQSSGSNQEQTDIPESPSRSRVESMKPMKLSLFSKGDTTGKHRKNSEGSMQFEDIDLMKHDPFQKFTIVKKKILEDDDEDLSIDSKSDKHLTKSDDEKDEKASQAESDESAKAALANELKNTIMNQFQSMYYKEENTIMEKSFKNLDKLKWFVYTFFFALTPLVLILYFAGLDRVFAKVNESVNNINSNEEIRRDFLKVTDSMVTFFLVNAGFYNAITVVTPSDIVDLMAYQLDVVDDLYADVLEINKQSEWISVLYRYVPEIEQTTTIDYGGNFASMTVSMDHLIQKLLNDFSAITLIDIPDFLITNSLFTIFKSTALHTFDEVLRDVSIAFFQGSIKDFEWARNSFWWFLMAVLAAMAMSLAVVFRYTFLSVKSLKQILFSFTSIDNKILKETEDYYSRLLIFFNITTAQYIEGIHVEQKDYFRSFASLQTKTIVKDNKFAKKLKRINHQDFLQKETIKVLLLFVSGILIYVVLNIIFFVKINNSISQATDILADGMQFVQIDTIYISSLIGIKFLLYDQTFYKDTVIHNLDPAFALLNTTLTTTSIIGNSEFSTFARQAYEGNVCEIFGPAFQREKQLEECKTLADGKLASGLALFHSYYSNHVLNPLQLKESEFGDINIDMIYEFGELIQIIDEVIMQQGIDLWRETIKNFLGGEETALLWIVFGLCFVNVIEFIIVAKKIQKILWQKFLFYRRVYNRYMLTEALRKEKLIRAGLVKYNLINR